jgi:uncharacterized protein (DUF1800 family)
MNSKRHFLKTSATSGLALGLPPTAAYANQSKEQLALHVLNRLGFGPRPGDIERVARAPSSWIEEQLSMREPLSPALIQLLNESQFTSAAVTEIAREFNSLVQQNSRSPIPLQMPNGQLEPTNPVAAFVRAKNYPAVQSRLLRAIESPNQLQEVMVDFWFNHFNVFQGKNVLRVMMGHYEHQAIRPHALGRFRDLLGATAHHPAMLYYLDNIQNAAPQLRNSPRQSRGLNENYARELMELHTLGVDGGYSQQDVTALARILTGWTSVPVRRDPRENPAQPKADDLYPGFWFNDRVHDNTEKQWLGYIVKPQGKTEGDFALDVLAKHPACARYIGFKLAQYFIHDNPETSLVDRLAKTFLEQDGAIVPVLRELFRSTAFWAPNNIGVKFKSPYHYSLSVLRATGANLTNFQGLAAQLNAQGQPLFGCLTPDGYKNTEAAWLNPDAMIKRINFATQIANGRLGGESFGPRSNLEQLFNTLGNAVSPATKTLAMNRASDPSLATALVLAGPNMMRR